jgi:hypothetical protein
MTIYFVSNAGSNTAPYDTEAKAATSLATIAALWVAGDMVKVSSTHTETAGAAITYTAPTTPGLQALCVVFNGSGTGGLATGASLNVGAASSSFNWASGFVYAYGLTCNGGTVSSASADCNIASGSALTGFKFESCTFGVPTANAAGQINIGAISSSSYQECVIDLINCVFSNGAIKPIIIRNGTITMTGCSLAGTGGTTIFTSIGGNSFTMVAQACDWNAAGTNPAFINVSAGGNGILLVSECKMKSGWSLVAGSFPTPATFNVVAQDCDSGDVHYTYIRQNYSGTITAVNSIYCGASDGSNNMSWHMVGNANTSFINPLPSPRIVGFNSSIGSGKTATIPVTNDGTTFTDKQLWAEVLAKVSSGSRSGHGIAAIARPTLWRRVRTKPRTSQRLGPERVGSARPSIKSWPARHSRLPNSGRFPVSFISRRMMTSMSRR